MSRITYLTTEALEGYHSLDGARSPYLSTSASDFAWLVGAWFKRTGRPAPERVRMGRGYQVHANDMLLAFDTRNAITRVR